MLSWWHQTGPTVSQSTKYHGSENSSRSTLQQQPSPLLIHPSQWPATVWAWGNWEPLHSRSSQEKGAWFGCGSYLESASHGDLPRWYSSPLSYCRQQCIFLQTFWEAGFCASEISNLLLSNYTVTIMQYYNPSIKHAVPSYLCLKSELWSVTICLLSQQTLKFTPMFTKIHTH